MDPSDWRPVATLVALQARARLLAEIRDFFARRAVLEVETPLLCSATATAPHLASFTACYTGPLAADGLALFLQTSPEFAMKRLVAAGAGAIYQIGKAFRNGESGRNHNPEFTLLEWYRPGFDHHRLMDEVEELLTGLLGHVLAEGAGERLTYGAAFDRHAGGVDALGAPVAELRACALDHGITPVPGLDAANRDAWLELLLTHIVAPRLGKHRLCFLYDYPASQAALARTRCDSGGACVAERFEVFVAGIELASGYHELASSQEQRQRFDNDNRQRQALGFPAVPVDERLLAALACGLPDCSGVAVGLDRVVMLLLGTHSVSEVLAFPLYWA